MRAVHRDTMGPVAWTEAQGLQVQDDSFMAKHCQAVLMAASKTATIASAKANQCCRADWEHRVGSDREHWCAWGVTGAWPACKSDGR